MSKRGVAGYPHSEKYMYFVLAESRPIIDNALPFQSFI